ncbi:hypothetical protein PDESU_05538 [Pontiella desulfatans]|uniref:Uncharacterized protein n=1 Tax=Pontiella desulfatans TaxID=2750659 RepID=A0A6C2UAC5_PONDE|nr:hypothetical protein [Pontiella desulfatans]VGO16945.1 hypothetical protein PDESU_05538 [Pontiella desulfatans]
MSKTWMVVASLVPLFVASTFGQSIADQLAVAVCSFRLYDSHTEVEVLDQMVTTRAVKSSNPELNTSGHTYFIEFTYKGKEIKLANAQVEFLDEHKRPLHAIQLDDAGGYMKVDPLGNRPNPQTRYIAISLQAFRCDFLTRW